MTEPQFTVEQEPNGVTYSIHLTFDAHIVWQVDATGAHIDISPEQAEALADELMSAAKPPPRCRLCDNVACGGREICPDHDDDENQRREYRRTA